MRIWREITGAACVESQVAQILAKKLTFRIQADKTQSSCLPNPASLAPCKLHLEHGTFFLDRYEHQFACDCDCGSTKMHVDHIANGCVLSGNWCPDWKQMQRYLIGQSCLTPGKLRVSQRAVCFWKGDVCELTPCIFWYILAHLPCIKSKAPRLAPS